MRSSGQGRLATVIRAGVNRGVIEFRQSFTGPAAVAGQLFWPVVTLVAIFVLRDLPVGGGPALGALILPGSLGMFVAFGGVLLVQLLVVDREDGTLLRAKATPQGIRGYLIGKLVTVSLTVLVYLAIVGVPGMIMIDGLELDRASTWLTFGWAVILGLVASQAVGAVFGSLINTPRGTGYFSILIMGIVAISGIFYPITGLPGWLQVVGQVFPIYWLGLGMRSALLPADAVLLEIGESWRQLETLAVLGGWAALGLILAPILVSRVARRESGSRVAERRERALQRPGSP